MVKATETEFRYDESGNILSKTVNGVVTPYVYDDNSDKLLLVGGQEIVYDNYGKPTTYLGKTLTWDGNDLVKVVSGTDEYVYEYDGKGRRIKKTVNGVQTNFIYDNGKLIRQIGEQTVDFIYGNGGVIGFKVANELYLYRKNLFGDVTHIFKADGTLVGSYTYTAFGECVIGENVGGIATLNPIRYRGYYYDTESNLYYLKTRYYDSSVGRFVSPDSVDFITADKINGLNLYAYCANNPIMNVDPNGTNWWSDFWTGVGNFFVDIANWFVNAVNTIKDFIVSTFGYAANIISEIYDTNFFTCGVVETGGGFSKGVVQKKPIMFNFNAPSHWWKIWDYSVGFSFNFKNWGLGFNIGTEASIKLTLENSEYEIFANLAGSVGFTHTEYIENGDQYLYTTYYSYPFIWAIVAFLQMWGAPILVFA